MPEYKGMRLSLAAGTLSFGGREAELTKTELKLMVEFLWDSQIHIDDNTLSVNMMRIREKLCALGAGNLIQTKRGMGYKI